MLVVNGKDVSSSDTVLESRMIDNAQHIGSDNNAIQVHSLAVVHAKTRTILTGALDVNDAAGTCTAASSAAIAKFNSSQPRARVAGSRIIPFDESIALHRISDDSLSNPGALQFYALGQEDARSPGKRSRWKCNRVSESRGMIMQILHICRRTIGVIDRRLAW